MRAAVSGFESEFGGRVGVRTVDVDTKEGKAALKRYDFRTHGLVMFDPVGRLLYKRADHAVAPVDVHDLLFGLLNPGSKPARPAAPAPAPTPPPAQNGPILQYQ